jgi:hypothetical protein
MTLRPSPPAATAVASAATGSTMSTHSTRNDYENASARSAIQNTSENTKTNSKATRAKRSPTVYSRPWRVNSASSASSSSATATTKASARQQPATSPHSVHAAAIRQSKHRLDSSNNMENEPSVPNTEIVATTAQNEQSGGERILAHLAKDMDILSYVVDFRKLQHVFARWSTWTTTLAGARRGFRNWARAARRQRLIRTTLGNRVSKRECVMKRTSIARWREVTRARQALRTRLFPMWRRRVRLGKLRAERFHVTVVKKRTKRKVFDALWTQVERRREHKRRNCKILTSIFDLLLTAEQREALWKLQSHALTMRAEDKYRKTCLMQFRAAVEESKTARHNREVADTFFTRWLLKRWRRHSCHRTLLNVSAAKVSNNRRRRMLCRWLACTQVKLTCDAFSRRRARHMLALAVGQWKNNFRTQKVLYRLVAAVRVRAREDRFGFVGHDTKTIPSSLSMTLREAFMVLKLHSSIRDLSNYFDRKASADFVARLEDCPVGHVLLRMAVDSSARSRSILGGAVASWQSRSATCGNSAECRTTSSILLNERIKWRVLQHLCALRDASQTSMGVGDQQFLRSVMRRWRARAQVTQAHNARLKRAAAHHRAVCVRRGMNAIVAFGASKRRASLAGEAVRRTRRRVLLRQWIALVRLGWREKRVRERRELLLVQGCVKRWRARLRTRYVENGQAQRADSLRERHVLQTRFHEWRHVSVRRQSARLHMVTVCDQRRRRALRYWLSWKCGQVKARQLNLILTECVRNKDEARSREALGSWKKLPSVHEQWLNDAAEWRAVRVKRRVWNALKLRTIARSSLRHLLLTWRQWASVQVSRQRQPHETAIRLAVVRRTRSVRVRRVLDHWREVWRKRQLGLMSVQAAKQRVCRSIQERAKRSRVFGEMLAVRELRLAWSQWCGVVDTHVAAAVEHWRMSCMRQVMEDWRGGIEAKRRTLLDMVGREARHRVALASSAPGSPLRAARGAGACDGVGGGSVGSKHAFAFAFAENEEDERLRVSGSTSPLKMSRRQALLKEQQINRQSRNDRLNTGSVDMHSGGRRGNYLYGDGDDGDDDASIMMEGNAASTPAASWVLGVHKASHDTHELWSVLHVLFLLYSNHATTTPEQDDHTMPQVSESATHTIYSWNQLLCMYSSHSNCKACCFGSLDH